MRRDRIAKGTSGTKYMILSIVFMVSLLLTFISMNFERVQPAATTMSDASLPVICMQTDEKEEFNCLHGYTMDIQQSAINYLLTPLLADRKLPIVIHTYGQDVTALSYKIRNLKDNSLIENTDVDDYSTGDNGTVTATFNIKNLIDDNTEYALEIVVSTPSYEEIHYYTKIITGGNYNLKQKIDFVKNFNDCTFDKSRLSEIQKYLETSSTGNNSNFGKVNINSTLAQVGWGDLEPYVESERIAQVKDINSDVAIICLEYRMGAGNAYDSYDSYRVFEYYRIRQTATGFYLLNFEREADQIFDGKNDLMLSSKINLGIQSDADVVMKSDENGQYSYFVNLGSLWCFNVQDNMYTKVFSFDADESDNIREGFGEHDIKIMNVDGHGNCSFMVYGYMNRGRHEGEVGVSLCSYSYEKNDVEERLYIPVDIPFEMLADNMKSVAYLTEEDKFYILMNDTLYSIDLTSKEVMVAVSGLVDGTYAASSSGDVIAYSLNGELYNTDIIRIFNMHNDSAYEIKAAEGDCLKALGYIKQDFIFGVAHKSDIYVEDNGCRAFAMYKLGILDKEYNLIKEYEEPDIYVSDADVNDMRVTLTRIIKSEDGGYEGTSIDQLINRDENVVEEGLVTDIINTEIRKQEICIKLINQVEKTDVVYRTSKEVVFRDDSELVLTDKFASEDKYYVYGFGKFQGSTTDISDAIALASDTYGDVRDSSANIIWKRYKSAAGSVEGISSSGCDENESIDCAVQILCDYAGGGVDAYTLMQEGKTADEVLSSVHGVRGIGIKGVSVDKMLSFIDSGCLVAGRNGRNSYVILTAYNSKEVSYIDVVSNKAYVVTISDANKMFSQWENMFITYYKD